MALRAGLLALVSATLLGACAAPPYRGPTYDPAALREIRWRAVLVAGDPSLPVWDNAVARLGDGLQRAGSIAPDGLNRFSAQAGQQGAGAQPASRARVLRAIRALRPRSGEACLIFLTMHGAQGRGLQFVPERTYLSAFDLDAALEEGCGDAPTFVVASGCYTGDFAGGRMARANRVVLAAARADRGSFGCRADFELTVFDACLLQSLGQDAPDAASLATAIRGCVEAEEARRRLAPPSEPPAWVGEAVRGLVPRWRAAGGA